MLFFAYFSVSKKQNIKRSPNGMKPSETRFSHQIRSRRVGPSVKKAMRRSRGWGHPPRPCPPASWAPRCSFGVILPPIYTHVPQTIRTGAKNLIPSPQLSISTRSHLGAYFGAPPEEGRHHGGLLHHHSLSDEV